MWERTQHLSQQPSHFPSLLESSGIIDVVYSFRCIPTSYDVYKLVAVPSLALSLSGLIAQPVSLVPVGPALAKCFDTANGSCALSVDKVRDRGSPNRESQHTSQG